MAGQTAGPNWLIFFCKRKGTLEGNRLKNYKKKSRVFKISWATPGTSASFLNTNT